VPTCGEVVLARFPFTDGSGTKLRPVLVLAKVPGPHDDYLVLFISSQIRTAVVGIDIVLSRQHPMFARSGLKVPSVLRIGKLATISSALILGPLGTIDDPLLADIVHRLSNLLAGKGLGSS
jgi:mRNA interferase MazF